MMHESRLYNKFWHLGITTLGDKPMRICAL